MIPRLWDLAKGNWETLEVEGLRSGGSNENMKRSTAIPRIAWVLRDNEDTTSGRSADFDLRDDATSLKVMIVNQEFVRRFLANRSVIGRKGAWVGRMVHHRGGGKVQQVSPGYGESAALFLHSYPPDFPARVWFDVRCAHLRIRWMKR